MADALSFDFRRTLKDLLPFFLVAWPYYFNDFYLIPLSGSGRLGLLWTLDVLVYLLIPAGTLWYLHRHGRLSHVRDALKMKYPIRVVLPLGLVLGIATHIVFTTHLNPWFTSMSCCKLCAPYPFPRAQPWHMLLVAYAAASAGIMEEIVFRAHLITLLKRGIQNDKVVIAASCILFGLIHWCSGPGKIAYTALEGLIPVVIYMRTGNLWLLVIWHTVTDTLAMWSQ